MKIRKLGNNETEVTIGDHTILYSYNTPVATHKQGEGYKRTSKRHSVTTTKHINKWLAGNDAELCTQEYLDQLGD